MKELAGSTTPAKTITDLQAIANVSGDFPPLPAIAMKAMQMASDPNVSARDLQAVISRDQALTAKILRVVNSAMYGLRREIATVSHAITILGMESVRSIMTATSIEQVMHSSLRGNDLGTKLLSDHSWGAALAARIIAARTRYEAREEAFLCGLLHDMGKLVLAKNRREVYTQIVSDVYRGEVTFHEAELQSFGFSHAHVGAILATKWNFPPQMAEAIMYHHDPMGASKHTRLACIVNLANLMMVFMQIGFEKNKLLDLTKEASVQFLKLDKTLLEQTLDEVRTTLAQMPDAMV